jgi:hypothetical protein
VFIPKYCEVGTGVSFDAGMSGGVTTRVAIARMAAERGESEEDMFFRGRGRRSKADGPLHGVMQIVQILQIYRLNL